ncbi:hypothetical protein C8R46DRAFT_1089489 [Mycena filopes]|nr:hypothetical protein C8R46DRAFT_1089489 [Mycena filopes]
MEENQEILVLESIFPDFITDPTESNLKLEIPVQLGEPRTVVVPPEDASLEAPLTLSLTSLPPLLLHIVLSATYPTGNPPTVSIRSSWLQPALVQRLHSLLIEMWHPGDGVLYDWVEYIRGGEFLTSLNLSLPSGVLEIRHPTQRLGPLFTSYDNSARLAHFSQESYNCAVCLTSVKGAKCMQLACSHVFCRSCLYDYWSFSIAEGSVEKLGCPDPACVKVGRESGEEEIARVVSELEVRRWRWLKEKIMFEKDPSLVHCPMVFCQQLVPRPPDAQSDSGGDRLRICPACSYSFCGLCKRTWHGAVQGCSIPHSEAVVLEYLAFEEDSKERALMENRFGMTVLRKLVAEYQEEQLNKKWLTESTMACPVCLLNIEKSMGCNHMTCTRCKTHFCFRCGCKLTSDEPYIHFSDRHNSCYQKLFDFNNEEREWEPILM